MSSHRRKTFEDIASKMVRRLYLYLLDKLRPFFTTQSLKIYCKGVVIYLSVYLSKNALMWLLPIVFNHGVGNISEIFDGIAFIIELICKVRQKHD